MKKFLQSIRCFILYQYLRFYKYSIEDENKNIVALRKYVANSPVILNYLMGLIRQLSPKRIYRHWSFNNGWEKKHGFRYKYVLLKYNDMINFRNECLLNDN